MTQAGATAPRAFDLDAPLTTLFTHDDPTLDVELQLIDEVIAERRRDAHSYTDAANPFRIRYEVMSVTDRQIAARLADARDAGVYVQLLVDYRQLDPAYPWLDTDEYLAGRGFTVVDDQAKLTSTTKVSTNLVGIRTSGFMHLKARLFETPASKIVLTGGQNASTEGWQLNDDGLQVIRDAALYSKYSSAYSAVLESRKIANTWDAAAPVNVLFTPEASGQRTSAKMLEWLRSESNLILLMVFSLRDFTAPGGDTLLATLTAKASAGVPVYVITDKNQSDGEAGETNDSTEDRLRTAGVHVYEARNARGTYASMHTKAAVLGASCPRVIADSANWSTSALGTATATSKNVESVLFIDSERADSCATGDRFLARWMELLSQYADQSVRDDGESDYPTVVGRLTSLPGWPSQEVTFTAHATYTSFGEDARVLGSLPQLGDWGRAAGGPVLLTDTASYPTWRSSASVAVPLGTWFEWKLAVTAGSAPPARWETGGNRSTIAMPPAFGRNRTLALDATWR
ncbi:phospholipase D-like domain-containing protein [Herbiconiux sp. CPCC 205763]|uniref:1,4-alpha-D-glucan glucanohydrolase n=1 Tax=Herbiconiux aconitum TaxID=2970913 RepID=A0ABT2GSH7_9MICO|nr:phospholipase D-like domain-containing protein [Herbiconiux aconitum]MCS5719076.1 phospholipase D-like domain-containing protein [Herbiconiux aconitum]